LSDGSFQPINSVSKAQLRTTAKMHRLIGERHIAQAARLEAFAEGELGLKDADA